MVIPWDSVQLKITEHETVQSDTVRVKVKATLSVSPEQADHVKTTLAETLSKILDTRWEISHALRRADAAGMERIVTVATVRVKEAMAAGMVARLQAASRSGFKLELLDISYRPPHEAIDAAKQRLRKLAYQRAVEEVATLNQMISDPGRPWQVNDIQLSHRVEDNRVQEEMPRDGMSSLAYRQRSLASVEDSIEDGSPDLSVGNRIVVEAAITLRRLAIPAPEGGFFARSEP